MLQRHGSSVIGLSNPAFASHRRRMLDLINGLHLTGIQADLPLPVIAVVGFQSAGKSSLIEAISGLTLPRAPGLCTRCPTDCRLTRSPGEWSCKVSLHLSTSSDGKLLGYIKEVQFGDIIYDKSEVEERIRRAQRAIINPSTDYTEILEGLIPDQDELRFSKNTVSLHVTSEEVEDLSFCDLPGVISSVNRGENRNDIQTVKDMVSSYISNPSSIILLTISCEVDIANQSGLSLAQEHDPAGKRTIGKYSVLTKPDRIASGDEDQWLRFIRNESEPLDHGWYCVKQPDSVQIKQGITWEEAREKEEEFFEKTSLWSGLDTSYRSRLGTAALMRRLGDVLSDSISKGHVLVGRTRERVQDLLVESEAKLMKLPKPPSSDALSEVLSLLATFSKALSQYVEGTPNADGLLQSIRPSRNTFRDAIRATEPDFRPYDRQFVTKNEAEHTYRAPPFLVNEGSSYTPPDNSRAILIDDVTLRTQEAVTRELPGFFPYEVVRNYVTTIVADWQRPAENLFHDIQQTLIKHVKALIDEHFSQYPYLKACILQLTVDFILTVHEKAFDRIQWFIALERSPATLNEDYYNEYHEKFEAHFKGWRPPRDGDPRGALVRRIGNGNANFRNALDAVIANLANIGLHGTEPSDLAKLLPPDPYDTSIGIMASVRAYFHVAHKRFMDNIPMAIDYELVRGLDRDQALEKALREGLRIGGVDGIEMCKKYIEEPPLVAERREELRNKLERLQAAKKQIMAGWH
ncbi:P-loop containing nucleoside triphosphate hydrolase protein [Epithele typhae]|uniref:P-loop containing nucleoside triphosphate hydrolase protein n=1 Tax=Epithele typhae TaxID=378194 RepID=UPI0020086203|nr:P-loop containing nucleoside triphosphate hydrolase protein [Epithele typhae]KAH9925891.1 P-loop containing nucleoside triphosphate hydrolase protein [Epithele typhae]